MSDAKKVVVQLPGIAKAPSIALRYELELEALTAIGVELVEGEKWAEKVDRTIGIVDEVFCGYVEEGDGMDGFEAVVTREHGGSTFGKARPST